MSDGMFYVATNDGEYKPIGKVSEIQIPEVECNDGDPIVSDWNMEFEFETEFDVSAFITTVKNFNTNNWRKLHGLRMLHRNKMPKRRQG